jgi:hypothetical protein
VENLAFAVFFGKHEAGILARNLPLEFLHLALQILDFDLRGCEPRGQLEGINLKSSKV